MNKQVQKIKTLRTFLLNQIDGLTTEQLNTVPAKLNNNIIWNLGHLLCATQIICYTRSGLPLLTEDKFITPYLPNTKPTATVNARDVDLIKSLFMSTLDTLQEDYDKALFVNYTKSDNIERYYGIELLTIEDALDFLLYHEGFHSGRITEIKHLV